MTPDLITGMIVGVTVFGLSLMVFGLAMLRISDDWRHVIQAYLEAKANQRLMVVDDPPEIGPPKFYQPIYKDPPEDENA